MKFILNEFPEDKNFEPNEGWTPLKESTNLWIVQLQAVPFMIMNVLLMFVIMALMHIEFEYNLLDILLSFVIFMPLHELIHALFFPESLKSNNVYFGFMVKGLAFFAAYIGEMKRNTFILCLMAPYMIISIIGFILLALIGSNSLIEHIIVFNAIGACADCLGTVLILGQVPKRAIVKNKKIRTYWRN